MLDGEKIVEGINLGIDGYDSMTFDETGKVLMGSGWLALDKETMYDYDF
jgi:simple sugar transport system substrate-binding protein